MRIFCAKMAGPVSLQRYEKSPEDWVVGFAGNRRDLFADARREFYAQTPPDQSERG
jgi:hypothetical protein